MEKLKFDRETKCDWCGCTEICAITHYGTTNYNRLVCVECAMSINQNDRPFGEIYFDLNNSVICFNNQNLDKEEESE